jgi:hypothetical protein
MAVAGGGLVEGGDHVDGLGDAAGDGGDAQPGVVIDDVEDLDLGAAGQAHVGDVHLPALVGELGVEPDVGALGSFVGLGGDEAVGLEHPPDRRRRGDGAPPVPAG